MITPQELRIGNITDKGIIKNFYESGIHVGLGKCFGFNELQPIELTEEWLLKFGFEREDTGSVSAQFNIGLNPVTQDYLFSLIWFKDYKNDYELKGFPFYRNGHFTLKYVHQLQNLYFALVGEGLTIK